jgi:hypothetical protein
MLKKLYVVLSVVVISGWIIQALDIIKLNKIEKVAHFSCMILWFIIGLKIRKVKKETGEITWMDVFTRKNKS